MYKFELVVEYYILCEHFIYIKYIYV